MNKVVNIGDNVENFPFQNLAQFAKPVDAPCHGCHPVYTPECRISMHVFEGNTADEVWRMAAAKFEHSAGVPVSAAGDGGSRELPGAAFIIHHPRQRWVMSREPAMNPAFAIAEVVWIVSGRRDAACLNYWNPKLPAPAGRGKQPPGAYGFRLRNHLGAGQLERACQALQQDPDRRQVVLQISDSTEELSAADDDSALREVSCNISAFAEIREGKLEWTQILRSNDLFLGVPHNFVQFTYLQEILAAWLGVEAGPYRHLAERLHMDVWDEGHLRSSRPVTAGENTDSLRFTRAESAEYFPELGRRMEQMTNLFLTQKKLQALARAEHCRPPCATGCWWRPRIPRAGGAGFIWPGN